MDNYQVCNFHQVTYNIALASECPLCRYGPITNPQFRMPYGKRKKEEMVKRIGLNRVKYRDIENSESIQALRSQLPAWVFKKVARDQEVVDLRRRVIATLRDEFAMSFPAIVNFFNSKGERVFADHTTVLYHYQQYKKLLGLGGSQGFQDKTLDL